MSWGEFSLRLCRNSLPHVLEESREMAELFAVRRPEQSRIAACGVRVEIAGSEDGQMEYFNHYCVVVEVIESLGTVYTFDSSSAQFMNLE